MFLKSLEIFGFKSFADRTRIEFSDGISALLGPNGCGKSNVVDAIKWVVGEQSARSLRAESMEDIIFNGTETRKALSVAEVTITISNESGLLMLDAAEIAIKRRLYRSGEAEYYINDKLSKLKEIRELFWDTGIGKSAYSVMEQGKIDQILSSKPEDRRYLFEEAAGITKHKVRSREAELKLERTEENMRQISGILGEVKRSHDTLKHQAEKTLKYRALRDEIFAAELDLHLLRLRQFVQEKDRRDEELAQKTRERDKVKSEIDSINLSLEENLDIVNGMEASLVEHQKTVYGLAVERVGKEKQRALLTERVTEARGKIDQSRVRLKGLRDKLETLRDDESDKQDELASLRTRLHEVEKNISDFEANIRTAELSVRDNEASAARADSEIAALEASRADARTRLDAITEDIVAQLDARLKESGYSAQERRAAEEAIESLIAAIQTRLSGKGAILEDLGRLQASEEGGRGAAQSGADPGGQKKGLAAGLIAKTAADLVETAAKAEELKRRYEDYKKTTPSFIDEFLSPEGIITRKREIDREIAGCDEGVAARRSRIAALRDDNRLLGEKVEEYRRTLEELRGNRIRMQTQGSAAEEALGLLRREIASQEGYLKELENEVYLEEKRLGEAEEELGDIDGEIADIEKRGRELTAELERLEREIAVKNSDLSKRQDDLKRKMERLGTLQSELERLHLGLAQTETEIRNVKENFSEQYSRDLMEFETRMFEIRTPVTELREGLSALKQKLKDLGSVNLMAPEEFAEVKERYDFLSGQLADLEKAKTDLKRITDEIRDESAALFLDTYNRIKKNFHNMFRRLFGGGRGELRLVDPNHVLESGIEIYAQPPGKKLEAISLLSGGEKTLTAIALLFATYMVRPSPFCFLDEIDAALDEQNVVRFVNLLREFGRSSQFVVITHNKKTVTGADALLGVTMEESGVTKVIAVRLERSDGKPIVPPEPLVDMVEEEVEYEEGTELPPEKPAPVPPEPVPAAEAGG
ncbi:MAG TPA: AAA family ATPase [Rectinemataceae bacterium]|nr:AAA family ATPase [Rectinemataceae bacterium]